MVLKRLHVQMEFEKAEHKAEDRIALLFKVSNESDRVLSVLKWNTPLEGFNNDMFIVSKRGVPATYLGKIVKRGLPTEADYVDIEPGKSVSVGVDLAEAYDIFEVGDYRVEYKPHLLDYRPKEALPKRGAAISESLTPKSVPRSDVVTISLVEERAPKTIGGVVVELLKAPKAVALAGVEAKLAPIFRNCSTAQQTQLNDALSASELMAWKARQELQHLRQLSDEWMIAERFRAWFGTYDDSVYNYLTRYNVLTAHFTAIHDVFANKTVTFDASCNENYYAYVYPTKPYEIYLCKAFWSAPLTGTDSKAGTLIHETSHFNVVASTDDHVYGQSGCLQLAVSNPANAIDNADNHEYFAENTPQKAMGHSTFSYAHLKAYNGQYVVAEGAGGGAVNANRPVASIWESFVLIDIGSGQLESGDMIHLMTYDGKHYLCAEGGGGHEVNSNRTWGREWETFRIRKASGTGKINNGDTVNLQAYNGNYVVAEGGGGGVVNANRQLAQQWETFTVVFMT